MYKSKNICFIVYVKTFDCVKYEEWIKLWEELEINGKDLRMIKKLYWDQKPAIRLNGKVVDWIEVQTGV